MVVAEYALIGVECGGGTHIILVELFKPKQAGSSALTVVNKNGKSVQVVSLE